MRPEGKISLEALAEQSFQFVHPFHPYRFVPEPSPFSALDMRKDSSWSVGQEEFLFDTVRGCAAGGP